MFQNISLIKNWQNHFRSKLDLISLAQQKNRGVALYVKEKIAAKQIYKDRKGRILIVELEINHKKVAIVEIYTLNGGQEQFYRTLKNIIHIIEYDEICLLGDFNAITDKKLDYKSNNIKKEQEEHYQKIFKMAEELNIQDI
uniref:Endonuclease/exonuclease/phosphatase domain-containing protein n=1 Tax=Micrurus spixii TaxID=129469 RepID=A0A2D4MB32_9SAUR